MNHRLTLGVVPLTAVLLAACGGSGTSGSTSAPAASQSGPGSTTLSTGSTSLGTVLTNARGLTLYYFTPEKGGTVACTGTCATTWPPLTASGTPSAPSNVTGSLSTVALADGATEVTYNGWPLHTYAQDTAPGQTNGQGIGGKWFAATPGLTAGGGGSSPSASAYGY